MLNVNAVTQQLREIIQDNPDLQDIWTHGKISERRPTQSGVLNFTLEENGQKIECVIFADKAFLKGNLPPVGSDVFVKGKIYVYETISEYRFMVTDISPSESSSSSRFSPINDLTDALKSTLNRVPPIKVQGEIAKVFVAPSRYTILKLKDGARDEQVNEVIECALPPGIDSPFFLQQGDVITVEGEFDIFSPICTYRIIINSSNELSRLPLIQEGQTLNQCERCGEQCEPQYEFCPMCYYAQLDHEGIVVGAVMRYFRDPKFGNFTTQREREIRFGSNGNIVGRADVALLNSEGNPIAIAECKKIGYDGNDGIDQLEGYINPTVAKLGLFADSTDPYEWTFLKKNDARQRFDPITRSQFERELGVESTPEIPSTKTQLELIQGNIIESEVGAIVKAANAELTRGSGVDAAIRDAGGEEINRACEEIIQNEGVCPPGKVVITTGGNLYAEYVIHTVGPIWQDGNSGEPDQLTDCYKNSLQLAVKKGIQSIAFSAISTGNYRYPIEKAADVALTTVKAFVEQAHQNSEMVPERIQFVLFDEEAYKCYVNAFSELGLGLFSLIG